ncbi:MAG TPA: T9SS type A sorting domain-containing protein [Rhodothermales bacterium]|nr:T9SS type A sorting domain-containing protein [Rhodothermales bacterium]
MRRLTLFLGALLVCGGVLAPSARAQSKDKPSSILTYNRATEDLPDDGYMVAGDLWDTVMPLNTSQPGHLGNRYQGVAGQDLMAFMHLGSEDAAFFNPGGMWPNAYRVVNLFRNARKFGFTAYDPNGWPGYAAGNPIFEADQGKDSKYMIAMYGPNVAGADDPSRNYKRPARYIDAARTQMIYEAGWPTTIGVDFKLRAHQFTSNEQNLNDFIVIEWTLTNTGCVDSDANGACEATNHVIDAIAASMQAETAPSIKIGFGGDRTRGPDGASLFGAGRTYGYVGAPDENGDPYDFVAWFANVPPDKTAGLVVPGPGARDFGINNYLQKAGYTDVWGAFRWMGVKQGSIGDAITGSGVNTGALSNITADSPDKQTIFGTDPIGTGPERGWYTSHTVCSSLVTYRWQDAVKEFRAATAVWYDNYSRLSQNAGCGQHTPDLNPNSRFFQAGTPGDITSFVPKLVGAQRPNGDYKYGPALDPTPGSGIDQPIWEEEWNPALRGNASPSDADFYKAIGYSREWNFDDSNKNGVGPFHLDVGESITIIWVGDAGYRFEGVSDAIKAAQWAWEHGWDVQQQLPVPPAPEMQVAGSETGKAIVRWTDVSSIDPDIDGYKIWRAAQYRKYEWLKDGMRLADNYQHQNVPGDTNKTAFRDPVNRFFDYQFTGGTSGVYQPEEWGTYELIAKIPKGDLSQHAADGAPYDYAYEDTTSILGFTYWYYVSSYKDGQWTGPLGQVADQLESSGVVNRNGRNTTDAVEGTIGMISPWFETYPFAYNFPLFPQEGTLAFKNMGAAFTLKPAVASASAVPKLITVAPNPYKITGLNDVRNVSTSHTINFLGVPSDFTITILDVSGQIIFQDHVTGGAAGQYPWNMFSKDGVEVASGLYIYYIQYGDNQSVVGHFAILR